jgi:hypothetical protein
MPCGSARIPCRSKQVAMSSLAAPNPNGVKLVPMVGALKVKPWPNTQSSLLGPIFLLGPEWKIGGEGGGGWGSFA